MDTNQLRTHLRRYKECGLMNAFPISYEARGYNVATKILSSPFRTERQEEALERICIDFQLSFEIADEFEGYRDRVVELYERYGRILESNKNIMGGRGGKTTRARAKNTLVLNLVKKGKPIFLSFLLSIKNSCLHLGLEAEGMEEIKREAIALVDLYNDFIEQKRGPEARARLIGAGNSANQ